MNIRLLGVFIFLIGIMSCSERISLADELACSKLVSIGDTNTKSDFNKKFSIEIPVKWKYKGYFDDYQSSVFAADTIKELTDSFIIDVAYKYNIIEINETFKNKIIKTNSLQVLKSNIETFKGYPSYWQVSKGVKNGYVLHQFQQFIQDKSNGYIEVKVEFYGENQVDERLCIALAIINTLEIN